ncbi:MAG: hypothetical protein AABZ74_16765, partial [Cyanobacteriota bacterium]
ELFWFDLYKNYNDYGYVIFDDENQIILVNKDLEITDYNIPDFWSLQKEPFSEIERETARNKTDLYFWGPKDWNTRFWVELEDHNIKEIIKFYSEYPILYKKNIKVSDEKKVFKEGLNVEYFLDENIAYLKQIDNKNEYEFITIDNKSFNMSYFGLTKGKIYAVHEFKNYENFWYKIKNDNNMELFYPSYLFKIIEDDNYERFYKFNLKYEIQDSILSYYNKDRKKGLLLDIEKYKQYLKNGEI